MAVIPSGQVPTQLVVNTGLSPAAVQLQIAAAIAAQAASDSATQAALEARVGSTYAPLAAVRSALDTDGVPYFEQQIRWYFDTDGVPYWSDVATTDAPAYVHLDTDSVPYFATT